jgi:hypothetical protein
MCPPLSKRTDHIQISQKFQPFRMEIAAARMCQADRPADGSDLQEHLGKASEKVFAFSSPYGILPLAMNLRRTRRFVVDSERRRAFSIVMIRDNSASEVK